MSGADLLARMWLIRAFEEKVAELYARGQLAGLIHLGIGQEAVAVGVSSELRHGDTLFAGHRAHGHALAMGADPSAMLAELAGRASGLCRGKGGSMHLVAAATGFMTATGVVGGNVPLALGAAWTARIRGTDAVSIAVFGDGAGQAGQFQESLNLASLWTLPVVLVCENNGYAEFTPLSAHTRVERLSKSAATFGIPGVVIDGNDLDAVREAMREAVERARRGEGPSFVECLTYRLRGHYEGDPGKYRDPAELAEWRAKDPIDRFAKGLAAGGGLETETAAGIEARARATIAEAAERALAAPQPTADDLTASVYA
jgi:pyruvate dehydrogenase E1 component alpha subunit